MANLDRFIRYFLMVVDQGTLSRAAAKLRLSESGVSRTISALEGHLGTPLFIRTGRAMKLTDAGRMLYGATRSAYEQIDSMLVQVRRHATTRREVRVAILHTIGLHLMAKLFADFTREHTEAAMHVLSRSSADVVDLIEQKKADVGIVYRSAVATAEVDITPLFIDEMCMVSTPRYAPKNGSIDLSKVNIPLIGFPDDFSLRRMLKLASLDDRIVAVAETLRTMIQLSSAGIGSCILPSQIPMRVLNEYGLTKTAIKHPALQMPMVAIVHHDVAPESLPRLFATAAATYFMPRV